MQEGGIVAGPVGHNGVFGQDFAKLCDNMRHLYIAWRIKRGREFQI